MQPYPGLVIESYFALEKNLLLKLTSNLKEILFDLSVINFKFERLFGRSLSVSQLVMAFASEEVLEGSHE
jgi:hypothetical protein